VLLADDDHGREVQRGVAVARRCVDVGAARDEGGDGARAAADAGEVERRPADVAAGFDGRTGLEQEGDHAGSIVGGGAMQGEPAVAIGVVDGAAFGDELSDAGQVASDGGEDQRGGGSARRHRCRAYGAPGRRSRKS